MIYLVKLLKFRDGIEPLEFDHYTDGEHLDECIEDVIRRIDNPNTHLIFQYETTFLNGYLVPNVDTVKSIKFK